MTNNQEHPIKNARNARRATAVKVGDVLEYGTVAKIVEYGTAGFRFTYEDGVTQYVTPGTFCRLP